MAKIKTFSDINIRSNEQVIIIPKGSFIIVSEEMAIYFCNEEIKNTRAKKANRTEESEQNEPHVDHTSL